MKSVNSDLFNHDEQAGHYDNKVIDERDPIRKGYACLLDKIVELTNTYENSKVLESPDHEVALFC